MASAARTIGGYEVLDKMGAGTVGTVYKARQVAMDRYVALKILNAKYASDPSFVKGFIAEARTAGRINHANVCQIYDVGSEGGVYFFSMELVNGPTLEQHLKEHGRMSSEEAVRIVRGVAAALTAAHGHGLVHRDVKPGNVILAPSGEPKLVDLGVAKDVTAPGADLSSGLVGTPYYMSPEQGQSKPVDIRSDIYSLGATFYHMLVGRPPFMGPHPTAVIVKHASEPLTSPSELDPEIPRSVSAVVEKMMAKSPDDRYATPQELIEDLDRAKNPELTLEPEPEPAHHLTAPRRRAPMRPPVRPVARPASRPAARSGGRRNITTPLAVGGGALIVLAIVTKVLFSGKDPSVVRAERDLKRAAILLESARPEDADEAASLARGVLRLSLSRPELRRRASRLVERADEERAATAIKRVDAIVLAVAEGDREAPGAAEEIERSRRLWEASKASRDVRSRVTQHCREAGQKIDAIAGKTDEPEGPRLGELATTALGRVDEALATDRYADAMTAIADVIDRVHGESRTALQEAKSNIRERAAKDFKAVMGDLQEKIDADEFAEAKADLEAVAPRFAFGAYPGEIRARLSEIRSIAIVREAEEERAAAEARVAVEARTAEETRIAAEARAVEEARAAEEARIAGERRTEEEAQARAAADAAAQEAAAAFFKERGWLPEGGTWWLVKDVLKLDVPEGSAAKLVFGKGARIADVTTQFDMRVLRGKGVRLQYRWTEGAVGDAGSGGPGRPPGGQGLNLSKGYALFVDPSQIELQVRGAPARGLRGWRNVLGGYQTWTKKAVRGTSWNRYAFQARGTRIAATVNTRMQLTRIDSAFESGMVRFEFLSGSQVEIRKLVIRVQ